MNGIKGEANTVNTRRGWEDSLAPALHANNVERPALEAMQEAVVASLLDFRRYLRAVMQDQQQAVVSQGVAGPQFQGAPQENLSLVVPTLIHCGVLPARKEQG